MRLFLDYVYRHLIATFKLRRLAIRYAQARVREAQATQAENAR